MSRVLSEHEEYMFVGNSFEDVQKAEAHRGAGSPVGVGLESLLDGGIDQESFQPATRGSGYAFLARLFSTETDV